MGLSTSLANAVKRSLFGPLQPSCAAKIRLASESKNGGKKSPKASLNQVMDRDILSSNPRSYIFRGKLLALCFGLFGNPRAHAQKFGRLHGKYQGTMFCERR